MSEQDDRPRRWELKCLPYPYNNWARREFDDEAEALRVFRELWLADPPAVNLSMRSFLVQVQDQEQDEH